MMVVGVLQSKTLFVVGAGASNEAGLPTGNELKATIAESLAIKFDNGFRQTAGDPQITEALRQHVQSADGSPDEIQTYILAG